MDLANEWFQLAAKVHLALCVILVPYILLSRNLPNGKRIPQVLFTILLPIVGPFIVFLIHWSDRLPKTKPSERYIGQSVDEHFQQHNIPPDN